jgi:hypothetical protein
LFQKVIGSLVIPEVFLLGIPFQFSTCFDCNMGNLAEDVGLDLLPIQEILEKLKSHKRCQSVTVEHWTGLQDSVAETISL